MGTNARIVLAVIGAFVALIAAEAVIGMVLSLIWFALILGVLGLAAAGAVALHRATRREVEPPPARKVKPPRGIVDCAGVKLSVGDTVMPGAGFDGPIEVAFGTGKIEKLARGLIHVRFDEDPDRVHRITPGTVRRLAQSV